MGIDKLQQNVNLGGNINLKHYMLPIVQFEITEHEYLKKQDYIVSIFNIVKNSLKVDIE